MNTGWILTVHDLLAKDRASKLCMLDHDQVTEKVAKIKSKGGSRVQVFANTPYSEVNLPSREKIRISSDNLNLKAVMRLLGKCNPLLIEYSEDNSAVIELDWNPEDVRTSLLESLAEVSVETLRLSCSDCAEMMKSSDGCWVCEKCGNTAG